jgi:hypothetical protein
MDEKILWSIGFVLVVVILCIAKPNAGRIFLGIFYLVMAIGINLVNAVTNPLSTVQMGEASLLSLYRTFFSDIVSKAPVPFILAIALFELIMGVLILGKHRQVKTGLLGTSVFLIFITPFGYIQLPWLGIAAVQFYLIRKDFDKTLIDMISKALRRKTNGTA